MTDLNLDGLPLLQTLRDVYDFTGCPPVCPGPVEDFENELRQLVEREQRLPAWAKPVMRAVVEWKMAPCHTKRADDALLAIDDAGDLLTEAQLKEIGDE